MTVSKKILLYGGTGFVGSAIAASFKKSYAVIAPTHAALDIADFSSLRRNINQTKPDVIIYASGLSSVDKCEDEPELARLLNAKVPAIIAAESKNLHIPVCYVSTDAVFYGNKKDFKYTEKDDVDPHSVYGKTKVAGEEAVLRYSNKNVVIRIICPFSPFYLKKTDFARMVVTKLSKNQNFPGIIDQTMNPLYMAYFTKALLKLVDDRANGIYHLGATNSDTNYNIVKRLAKLLHLKDSLITKVTLEKFLKNKKAIRSQYSFLDVSKFQNDFGKGIVHDLDTSLKDFVKDIKRSKVSNL